MKTKLSLTALLSFSFYLLSSQVPQGFNYQAIARDGSGNPISTPINVKIAILTSTDDADLIWEELHAGVDPDDHGLFSIVVGNGVTQAGGLASFSLIDWTETPLFIRTKINDVKLGTTQLFSVPYAMVADSLGGTLSKLKVKGSAGSTLDEALFEVKNKTGQTVFAVYNEGVRIYVDNGTKGAKGGFSVGGFGTDAKLGESQPMLIVNRDSVNIFIHDNPAVKAPKGGFSVGGYGGSKGYTNEYLRVTPDSVRVYIDNRPTTKGAKGGFSVGGFDGTTKGETQKFLSVSIDSVRVYIDDTEKGKGAKGGFSVGGYGNSKGAKNFLNIATDESGIVDPAVNRILWYPYKNAFLTGRVLITDPNNVGDNSFATGYEAKAKGMYSQSMGYLTRALADFSTAIGKNAEAIAQNSFAFGDGVQANKENSFSFGQSSSANGLYSYAFGQDVIAGSDVSSNCYAFGKGSHATGDGSYAFGSSASATGPNSTAFGKSAQATNTSSFAFGESALAESPNSFALGLLSHAYGSSCYAIGESAQASNQNSVALGKSANASGANSFAAGWGAIASAEEAVSIGLNTNANGAACIAMGFGSEAGSQHSGVALGEYAKSHGYSSVSAGYWTLANETGSVALGLSTKSMATGCTALGKFNLGLSNSIFEIGNGLAEGSRSNAFTILNGGSVGIGTSQPIRNLHLASDGISSEFIMETKGGLADWRKWEFVVYDGVGGSGLAQNLYLRILNDAGNGISRNVMSWLSTGAVYMPQVYSQIVGSTNVALYIDDTGKLGYNASSIRYKENIYDLNNINWLYELRPVIYNYKGSQSSEVQYGLIAEEVEGINPRLIIYDKDNKPDGLMYEKLSVPMLKAVQEQKNEIEAVKQENNQLKSELQSLKDRMEQLEAVMARSEEK